MRQLRAAVEAASDEDGWAALGYVGTLITKQQPDLTRAATDTARLLDLMTATTVFDLERRSASDGRPGAIYIREKRGRSAAPKAESASASTASAPPAGSAGSAASASAASAKSAKRASGSAAAAKTPADPAGRST